MSDINISVIAGEAVRLKTAGKYCENDVVVTADNPLSTLIDGTIMRVDDDSVTTVKDYAFYGCSNLTNVTLSNAETIGEKAFGGCNSLTSVNAPKAKSIDMSDVTNIHQGVLRNCSNLESVTIPFIGATKDAMSYSCFGFIFGAPSFSYNGNFVPASLKTVIITGGTEIANHAFRDCTSLTSITIPDSVTSIGLFAFYGCTSLTSITIPDSVTSIGEDAFSTCASLTSVTLGNGVTSISSDVFSECSSLTSVTLGNSIMSIGKRAFQNCTSLTSISIPDSVTSIGEQSFRWCDSLASVTLGNGVTSIGEGAFYGCSSLETITYGGTTAQWEAIEKGSNWDNGMLNYTVYCTDGDITK